MNPTDFFEGRIGNHDIACSIFLSELQTHSIESVPVGNEYNLFNSAGFLKPFDNDLAKFIRHFPDMYVIVSNNNHVLVDVKSDSGKTRNFAIEADSLYAGIELSSINKPVFFACVVIPDKDIRIISAEDLRIPERVFVPSRRSEQFLSDIKQKFPKSDVTCKNVNGGSGTPYVLIPKDHPCFLTLNDFLQHETNSPYVNVWKFGTEHMQKTLVGWISA